MQQTMGESPLLASLNEAQRRAVETVDGPVLVIAGAGSGKTRVLTHRLAHLVGHHGVPADRIMAITFTNKAAGEMQERVRGLIGARHGERAWVTTFHKTGVRILRREAAALDLKPGFTIYDGQDVVRLVGRLAKDAGIDEKRLPPRAIANAISRAKDELVTAAAFRERASGWPDEAVADVYTAYELALRRAHALDLDDLIVRTVDLFRGHPDVLDRYRQRFTHLMIDEYQDTNRAQYHLVQLLAAERRNLMVVGDPDQGVYSFRGATIRNILDFEQDYPDATVIPLTRNYRSTRTIPRRGERRHRQQTAVVPPRTCGPRRTEGAPITRYHATDEHDEAHAVVREIEDHLRRGGAPRRRRRVLPHQRPVPCARGRADARVRALPGRRAACASTSGARSRTSSPTCSSSPTLTTTWRSVASSTCRAAASATAASPRSKPTRSPERRA